MLIQLLVALIIIGLVLYLIQLIPMDPGDSEHHPGGGDHICGAVGAQRASGLLWGRFAASTP